MGYTHYGYYKNPVIELAKLIDKKVEIHRQGHSWAEIKFATDKLPSHDSLTKKIAKHVEAFKKIKSDLEHILPCVQKDKDFVLCNGNGKGNPEITDTIICFNGDASTENDFETFSLKLFESPRYEKINETKDDVFIFCKTARQPYDIAVCLSLMVIKHHLGSDFRISSDGNFEEWNEAIKYYESYFKRKAPKQLITYFKKEAVH